MADPAFPEWYTVIANFTLFKAEKVGDRELNRRLAQEDVAEG